MTLKEFKKVFSNKWIVFLLWILCVIQIFVITKNESTNGELSVEESAKIQQEKIEGYSDYVSAIRDNENLISGFSLFNKNDDYQKQSGEKTVRAYERVENVKPVYGNYELVSRITSINFSDVIIIIIMLQCVIVSIHADLKYGVMTLLKSCKKGRVNLIAAKMKSILIADVIVVTTVYVMQFIVLYLKFGCSGLNVPIQSVPEYYSSALPVSILEYMILYLIFKWMAVFSCSMIMMLIAVICNNSGVVYAFTGMIWAMSVIMYTQIDWDYALALLKVASPVTLIDVQSYTCKYYNINILGNPWGLMSVIFIFLLIYIVFAALASMFLFSHNKSLDFHIKAIPDIEGRRTNRIKGMTAFELKKLLLVNKGMIIFFMLILAQGYLVRNVDTELSENEKFYAMYIQKVEGEQTEQTNTYMVNEKKRYKKLQTDIVDNTERFLKGEISELALEAIRDDYERKMSPYEAFRQIQSHRKYLNKLKKNRGIKGWYLNDTGINYIFNPNETYNEKAVWMLIMLALILLIVPCFAIEEQTGMERLNTTTIQGGRRLQNKKLKISIVMATLIYLVSMVPYLVVLILNYDFSGVVAPVQSLEKLYGFPLEIPIWLYLIIYYLIRYIIVLAAMALVIVVSKKCYGYIKKIAVSVTLLIVPIVIFMIL